ncbi:MAG: ParA family protein [Candidatus Sabulitectum sp.]|nr:ParA family protein [Candidatus Sabulitectum sp.]
MTRILAVANQKGGVGKTTTVINLGASIAVHDKEVLVIDLDPQANATSGLGHDEAENFGIHNFISGEHSLKESTVKTEVEGLCLVRGARHLAGTEIELASQEEREFFLEQALSSSDLSGYDYVLIDCPPSLGLLTINALVAADGVILPVQSEYYALEGLSHLMETIRRIKAHWNKSLSVFGVVLTMYDKRLKLSREVEEEANEFLGKTLFRTRIPRNVRLSEAPSYGKPVILYDAFSRGAKSYMSLAREVMAR